MSPVIMDNQPIVAGKFSELEYQGLRFVIMDCPSSENVEAYSKSLKNMGVTHVVRLCEPTYDSSIFTNNGLTFHDMPFKDGQPPPDSIVAKWLNLLESVFKQKQPQESDEKIGKPPAIAVHCVAGLGRAPVLVAISLVEKGLKPLDAIEYVRKYRRGAFNSKQLQFIDSYKKRSTFSNNLIKGFSKIFKRKTESV